MLQTTDYHHQARPALPRPPRPALPSGYLSFRHPLTGENMQFSVPLPEDMSRLKM